MSDCLSCDGRTMGWCAYCANYPPKNYKPLTCEGCINKGQLCLSCKGQFYAQPVKKPEHKPSAWEKRWIRWVKKNER